MKKDDHISLDEMEKYMGEAMGAMEATDTETHLSACELCRDKLQKLKQFDTLWEDWTPGSQRQAFQQLEEAQRAQVLSKLDAMVNRLPDAPNLSEFEIRQRRRMLDEAKDSLNRNDEYQMGRRALAAAPEASSGPSAAGGGETGYALGVAVDERSGIGGEIVSVAAWVSTDNVPNGTLSIVGIQAEDGIATPPLDWLEKYVVQLFRNVLFLSYLDLTNRNVDVRVTLSDQSFLDKGDSLTLAVIVAIAKAAIGTTGYDHYVYSADVEPGGSLKRVGMIDKKSEIVFQDRAHQSKAYHLVIPDNTFPEIPESTRNTYENRIHRFHTVENVCHAIGLNVWRKESEDSIASTIHDEPEGGMPDTRENGFSKVISIILVLASLVTGGILTVITRKVFSLADLIMAWHMWNPDSYILYVVAAVSSVVLYDLVKNIVMKKSWRSQGVFRALCKMALFIYLMLNSSFMILHLGIYNDRVEKYNRIEYLKYAEPFNEWTFVKDIPNYRFIEFNKLAAGPDEPALRRALELGLGARIDDPVFKRYFIDVTRILLSPVGKGGVRDPADARDLIFKFLDYAAWKSGQEDARGHISELFDAAGELVSRNNYDLGQKDYRNIRISDAMTQLKIGYDLK